MKRALESLNALRDTFAKALGDASAFGALEKHYSESVESYLFALANTFNLDVFISGGLALKTLAPGADIDVGVAIKDARELESAERFCAALWDAGLTPGVAIGTWNELLERASTKDTHFETALFFARVLKDHSQTSDAYLKKHRSRVAEDRARVLSQKATDMRERRKSKEDIVYLREPNVKSSPGGLRDIQTAIWMTGINAYQNEMVESLSESAGLFSREVELLKNARLVIARIRWALHTATKRKEDRLLYEHQDEAAALLSYENGEALMAHYFAEATKVRRTVDDIVARLSQRQERGQERKVDEDFCARGDIIYAHDDALFTRDVSKMIDLVRLSGEEELKISSHTQELLYQRAEQIRLEGGRFDDEKVGAAFLTLAQSKSAHSPFKALLEFGLLGALLQDFARLDGLYKQDAYHAYTVDAHSCRCADLALAFCAKQADAPAPLFDVAARSFDEDALVLASLFHDVGKGSGRDHSEVGEEIVRRELVRFGASQNLIERVALLVREHLLLSRSSQRRDLSDPLVIEDIAERVQDVVTLDTLTLLTWIDTACVAPGTFTDWKARLLRLANERVRRYLLLPQEGASLRGHKFSERLENARQVLLPHFDKSFVERFVSQSPDFVLSRRIEQELMNDAQVFADYETSGESVVRVEQDGESPATVVRVVTKDRPFLFASLANAVAAIGANLLHAHLCTREDKVVIDAFRVNIDGRALDDKESDELRRALTQALFENHAQSLSTAKYREPPGLKKYVLVGDEPGAFGLFLVEIRAFDRPGLAADLACVFSQKGFSIALAKLASEGDAARDSFYVRGSSASLSELKDALIELIGA